MEFFLSSGDPSQALKKIEKVTEQFSSYMNCSYGTRSPTEPIPRARLSHHRNLPSGHSFSRLIRYAVKRWACSTPRPQCVQKKVSDH